MTHRALYLALRLSIASFASTAAAQNVDLANLGERGFRINGIAVEDRSGRSVSGAGDINGDGLSDLIVGAADAGGNIDAGASYVVFGKPGNITVELANLGANGFRIDGIDAGDELGRSVSGAGGINGDGLADLVIGAANADPGGDNGAGDVVFGKADSAPVNLTKLGAGGFRIDGVDAGDRSGNSVSGAGDVNGDGLADVIIGAHQADPDGKANAGESYVMFSAAVAPPSAIVRARSANGNPSRTAFGSSGNGGNDSIPDARAFIDFANGSDANASASASTETMALTRSAGGFPDAAASVSWQLQTTRQNWTAAELRLRYLDSELLSADESSLQIVFSADGAAPFTPLPSIVNTADNSITATVSEAGFYFIGEGELPSEIFANGFEQQCWPNRFAQSISDSAAPMADGSAVVSFGGLALGGPGWVVCVSLICSAADVGRGRALVVHLSR